MLLRPGQPCRHPGCLHHISHPCEGCGRIGGQGEGIHFEDTDTYKFMVAQLKDSDEISGNKL